MKIILIFNTIYLKRKGNKMETVIKKVLVPIDFSDYSKSALKYAVNFTKSLSELIIPEAAIYAVSI